MQINAERLAQIEALLREKSQPQDSGCVLWTGYTQPNGYGYINIGKLHVAAHRAALLVAGGHLPDDMDACHTCDVRACIEPTHLYAGTRKQNMADCTARGRHNKPTGEAHWAAKLTSQDVASIRAARSSGATTVSLAKQFNVNHATISRIARGIWRTEVSL